MQFLPRSSSTPRATSRALQSRYATGQSWTCVRAPRRLCDRCKCENMSCAGTAAAQSCIAPPALRCPALALCTPLLRCLANLLDPSSIAAAHPHASRRTDSGGWGGAWGGGIRAEARLIVEKGGEQGEKIYMGTRVGQLTGTNCRFCQTS